MKKIFFTLLIGVFMITGCGAGATKTMKCTYQNSTGSISSKTTYNIDYENNDVKKVRVTYNYHFEPLNDTDGDGNNDVDGVGTGTDGTTNDTQIDNDGIIDGVVGSAIDSIVSGDFVIGMQQYKTPMVQFLVFLFRIQQIILIMIIRLVT